MSGRSISEYNSDETGTLLKSSTNNMNNNNNNNNSYKFDKQQQNIPINYLDNSPHLKSNPSLIRPIFLCLIISFTGLIFGWDIGTIGGIVNMPVFRNTFGNIINFDTNERTFSPALSGLIIGIFNMGAAIGGLTLGKIGDIKGRRFGLFVSMTAHLFGVCIELIEDTFWFQFFIGRWLTGMAIGSTAVLVPMYLSENSPLQIRGAMIVLYQLMITLGILLGNIFNFVCHNIYNDQYDAKAWQLPIFLNVFWDMIVFGGILLIPESTMYLGKICSDIDGAQRAFAKMNGVAETDHLTIEFIGDLKYQLECEKREEVQNPYTNFEFLNCQPRLPLRLLIGILVMTFQQLSGINYFFYYGTVIFKSVGFDDPYLTTIILSFVNFISTFGGVYLVEKLGRRTCFILGCVSLNIAMLLFGTIGGFGLKLPGSGICLVIVTCLYVLSFAVTLGPVSFVLVSEIFPVRTKAISIAICSFFNWIMNFLVSLIMPLVANKIGFFSGYIFAGFLTLGIIFGWYFVPETKGKTEDDINEIFE